MSLMVLWIAWSIVGDGGGAICHGLELEKAAYICCCCIISVDQDGRPNTAATSQTDQANWDDIWRDVQSNVKRHNDDAQTAMKRFKSDGGRRAAMLISILDPMTKEQLDEIERRSSQNSQSDYKIETKKLIINEGTKDERE
eukprot:scaffold3934_cov78-Skeletonema_marinoi.AAC.1